MSSGSILSTAFLPTTFITTYQTTGTVAALSSVATDSPQSTAEEIPAPTSISTAEDKTTATITATTTATTTANSNSKTNPGAIAGEVIGVVVLLSLIALGIYVCVRKRRRRVAPDLPVHIETPVAISDERDRRT